MRRKKLLLRRGLAFLLAALIMFTGLPQVKAFAAEDETDQVTETQIEESQGDEETPPAEGQQEPETPAEETTAPPETTTKAPETTTTAPETTTAAPTTTAPHETTKAPETTTAAPHTHTWVEVKETRHHDAVYETVHHDAVTEDVWVVDSPGQNAWDEEVPKYTVITKVFCHGCDASFTTAQGLIEHQDTTGHMGYYDKQIQEQVGTETIHHDAVPEVGHWETKEITAAYDETVVAKEAYDEQVITGYKCSTCGATK